MKRLCLMVSVAMIATLGFAAFTWAGEASVFDSGQEIIIRAYTIMGVNTNCGKNHTDQCYSVYLEVWDVRAATSGTLLDATLVSVTDQAGTASPRNAGLNLGTGSCTLNNGTPTGVGCTATYVIHNDDASSPAISMSFDSVDGITYLFCSNGDVRAMKYKIVPQ